MWKLTRKHYHNIIHTENGILIEVLLWGHAANEIFIVDFSCCKDNDDISLSCPSSLLEMRKKLNRGVSFVSSSETFFSHLSSLEVMKHLEMKWEDDSTSFEVFRESLRIKNDWMMMTFENFLDQFICINFGFYLDEPKLIRKLNVKTKTLLPSYYWARSTQRKRKIQKLFDSFFVYRPHNPQHDAA